MTTSPPIYTTPRLATEPGTALLLYIRVGLESLWLLAIFMVPLIFLDKEYAVSEAKIANIEIPKVALLRTLGGLLLVLWSLEWAITSSAFHSGLSTNTFQTLAGKIHPSRMAVSTVGWLKVHPTRWLLLAAALFFGSTFLSTVLSGSINNSLWGEIPGQGGYSAYTIGSYGVLFGVIATHVKSRAQLWRFLGAAIAMGFLVGLYASFQHFGHDFLGATEVTGGGTTRVTAFMGNAIFAGAVLAMTVPLTLVVATLGVQNANSGSRGPLLKLRPVANSFVLISGWAVILAVQILGLMFTFSRGPWSGALLGLIIFLGLVAFTLGFRLMVRAGLILGLAVILSFGLLHWQGSVSIVDVGPRFGFVIAALGLAGVFATLFFIERSGKATVVITAVGAAVVILGAITVAPSFLSDRGATDSPDNNTSASQITDRFSSIHTDARGGFTGGRATHWKVSWKLIKDRPWFEFDDLSLPWLRQVIGYGPDLFRYTYLIESPVESDFLAPLEPDHAHNFFIHQTVEQGILGGIASLALFLSVFGVAGHHLLRRRKASNPVYLLLIIGLSAIMFGRFLEMMVGVARISDLTVLWALFGLFAALVYFDNADQVVASDDKNTT